MPLPHDPGPHWGEVGIHGLHRQREWDAVVMVHAPAADGDEQRFVVLDDQRVVGENGTGDDAGTIAVHIAAATPFRARAVRREGTLWAVAVRRIETVELEPDPGGSFVELVWDGVERSVRIDGEPTLTGVPVLERIGAARSATYVVTAERLAGSTWEIAVAPL